MVHMDNLFLPLMLAMAVAFLFLSFRNQKKRTAAMEQLKAQAVPGARIQLSSGLFGTVRSDDGGETVDVEIAPGVITTWNRLAIREVVAESGASEASSADEAVDDSAADDTAATAETVIDETVINDAPDSTTDSATTGK